jgi:hypothetical protein
MTSRRRFSLAQTYRLMATPRARLLSERENPLYAPLDAIGTVAS